MPKKTFAVVGLGLLGGSLAQAIRKKIPHSKVIGVSRSTAKIRYALRKKIIHQGFTHLSQAVFQSDFVIVCTPVDTVSKIVREIDSIARRPIVVTDVASTKEEIVRSVTRRKLKHVQFAGSHPMAGSHVTGIEHSSVRLFEGATTFVTPSGHVSAVQEVSAFWKKLGARTVRITPQKHDQVVSQISHLPHAVASLLVQSVSESALPFAATGFMDSTRIAQGDPRLWTPIFMTNRKNLLKDLIVFERNLKKLLILLRRGRISLISQHLKLASARRSKCR